MNLKHRLPLIAVTVASVLCIAISIFSLKSGQFIIFQNLFYIPIFISCYYYTKQGFAISVALSCIYFFLIIAFTSDPVIIRGAVIRVILFILIAAVITALSITRAQAEEALKKEREKFRTVADFTYNWEYWADPQQNILYVSPSCERISGYRPEDFMTESGLIHRVVHPDDRDIFKCHADHYHEFHIDSVGEVDFRIVNRNGEERWIAHLCQPVYSSDGQFLGRRASNLDITEKRRAEEALRESEESNRLLLMEVNEWGKNLEAKVSERTREIKQMQTQLIRSEKLVSLGRLVAGITHEINNPLTGILLFANLTSNSPNLDPLLKKDLAVIINEANRCAKIVNGMLDFSRESIPQKKPASLNNVMEATLVLIGQQSIFHNINFVRDYQPDLPLIPVDESQIERVFINMLLNAGQSMPGGGSIRIETYTENEEFNCVKITDTGTGITEENLGKIFDPFFTTKNDKGAGLGLSISYGIIERHGGKIEVQSNVREGTTFTIKLPLFPQGGDTLTASNPAQ
jgi:PAS domain S-box-containing protein